MHKVVVGRERELGELAELLSLAQRGDGKLALVGGEPGIGKTTLVETGMQRAREAGWSIAWGRAWEDGGAPAYWPWIQIVRAIHRDRPDVAVPAELAGMIGTGQRPIADDRFALYDAMLQYLAAAGAQRALVIEDLHAAEHASLLLLAFVAAHLAGIPIAIVGTFRTSEAHMTPEVGATIDKLARAARSIAPRRLTREDVAQLAGALPATRLDEVYRASEGNPLFAIEILRILEDGAAHATAELVVPETVRAAIREHVARLAPSARAVATSAAVVGREVTVAQLTELMGRDERDTLIDLRHLVERGVMTALGPATFRFAHALFAATLHDDLEIEQRHALHARVADILESSEAASAALAEITRHRFAAGPGQLGRAIEVARRAAEAAIRALAYEEAVALLERALAATAPAERVARAEIEIELGVAYFLVEQIETGRAHCVAAADLARALGSGELLARAAIAIGKGFAAGIVDLVLVGLIEESLAALPPGDSPVRAQLMARLASALQPASDPEPPMKIAREAIAMARRIGDDRTLLAVLYAAMSALANFAPGSEREPLDREALALALRFDEPATAMRCRYRILLDCLDRGDLDGAIIVLREYQQAAAGLRVARVKLDALLLGALLALHTGTFATFTAGLADARTLVATNPGCVPIKFIAEIITVGTEQCARGLYVAPFPMDDYLRFYNMFPKGLRIYPASGAPFAHALGGQLERARAAWTRLELDEVICYQDLRVLTHAAVAAILLDDREAALRLYRELGRYVGRWASSGFPSLAIEGPMSAYRFLLADYLGLPSAAEEGVAMVRELRASGATLLLARFLADYARARSTPRAAAEAALAEARAVAERAGIPMGPFFDAVVFAPTATTTTPSEPMPAAAVAAVRFTGEGEVWLVTYDGHDCRVKTTRGVELLAKLVGHTGEIHVLDLVGAQGTDDGDAGEVIDREALVAYRRRAIELREELAEAESWNDRGRRERAEAELESLEAEVRAASGLGGRIRRNAGAAERARVNVRRRIADAIARIAELAPPIGRHLDLAVRTGMHCSYDPRRIERAR